MVYKLEHERISRGAQLTRTKGERDKEFGLRAQLRQELIDEMNVNTGDEYRQMDRERIEAKFLCPKTKNFVLTDNVEAYAERGSLWLKAGYPVHLIGPTGCGKTSLALHLAEGLKKPVVWINGDEELTTHELIGGYSRIEMRSLRDKYIHNVYKSHDTVEPTWINNPLALACQQGYTLIYNEFSRSKPEANNVLLSILEEGVLELPTKFGEERYIKVHPKFNLILTSNNIDYAGVHKPQDALLDRVPTIYMDYYDEATEIAIVKAHSDIAENDARKIVFIVRALRKSLNGAEKPGTRPAIMIAQGFKTAKGKDVTNKDYLEQLCVDAIASKSVDTIDLEKKRVVISQLIDKLK